MKQLLFDKVFKNIILRRLILKYVKLYKKNQRVVFRNRKRLLEYKEKEFISELIYKGKELLENGDLPINGVLKSVEFTSKELINVNGNAIPYGVSELSFFYSKQTIKEANYSKDPFSTYPSTINTINNAIIKVPFNIKTRNTDKIDCIIPSNITSISFIDCPYFSNDRFKIPNTIKILKFFHYWDNGNKPINKEDLPESLTSFTMVGFQKFQLADNVLPKSLNELSLSIKITVNGIKDKFDFNFIHHLDKLESLHIQFHYGETITPECNLSNCNSIKKLDLYFLGYNSAIKPNSLPPSVTDLTLANVASIEVGSIPNNVSKLTILFYTLLNSFISIGSIPNSVTNFTTNKIITQPGILPPSLVHLQLTYMQDYNDDFNKMISILPSTLKTITISKYFKKNNIQFPQSIIVNYNDNI